ncbi:MAG TPA: kelch repeat-containing protein [Chitinophagales bacterium]|nr:kelch repeat-containing protein [Chitinophagales bacterium]
MKKILPLFVVCLCLNAKADNWTQKTAYPGAGQELPISFSIGDKGYAGCGTNANDFWEYDPANDTWTQKANVPGPARRAGVGFSIGNKGYAGTGEGPLNDFYEYDPVTNTWTAKASISTGRSFATGFSIGTKGYIGCGQTPTLLSDFWEYDPATNLWTQKSSLPFVRSHCVGFSISGKGYMTTGFDGNFSNLNDIWEYDPAANTWTQKADMPAAGRTDACGFVICDMGYVMTGGEFPYYDDLWQYDPVLNQWVQKATVPGGGRDDGASFAIGTKGYFGLGQLSGTVNTNDFWEYSPDNPCSVSLSGFSASDTTLCEKFCINYFDSSANNPTAWLWIFPGGAPASSTDQNPTNICYDTPGTYDVTLITTGANGSDTLTLHNYITVYPTPPFPTITQAGYTLTSSSAASYQWQFNSVDIPGATNQEYTILQTGYYTVVVGDSNSCKNSFTVYVLISGINEVMTDANISIYPNPATDGLMVEWLNGFAGDEITLTIVNTLGQEIFSTQEFRFIGTADWKKEIDLRNAPSGVYFIEIKLKDIGTTPACPPIHRGDFFRVNKKIVVVH